MARDETFNWLDTELIGELLAEAHPSLDPITITFPRLKSLVMALPGFREEPGHPVNEKILEHIQAAWIDERDHRPRDDD